MSEQPQPPAPPPPPPPAPEPAPMPTSAQVPAIDGAWLRALLEGAVQPKDPRVKGLWDLLRQRRLLARSPWARTRLRFVWQKGLNPRPRPRMIDRLLALLENRAPLSASPQQWRWSKGPRRAARPRAAMRRLQPVRVRRVGTLRPVGRPRQVRPLGSRPRGR